MTRYWAIRMTVDWLDDWKTGFNNNFVAIGWAGIGDTSSLDEDEIIEKNKEVDKAELLPNGNYRRYWSDGSPREKEGTERGYISDAKVIRRFIDEVKKGDIMLLPRCEDKSNGLWGYCIGQVTSDLAYYPKKRPKDQENYGTRWDVKWLKQVPKESFSEKFRNSLKGHLTLFNLDDYAEEIEKILSGKKLESKPLQISSKKDMIGKLSEVQNRLLDISPSDFEKLICEVLSLKYDVKAVKTRDVADGGIDFVCIDELGETVYRGQAKRISSSVGNSEILKLRGTLRENQEGVFVTSSEFTNSAMNEADSRGKKKINLIGGRQLSQMILDVYDNLDEKFKNILKIEK